MIYFIIANIALIISFTLYHLFFRKLTFFQWNRYYLLGAVVMSFLVPVGIFIDLSDWREASQVLPTVDIGEFVEIPMLQSAVMVQTYSLVDLFRTLYIVGLVVALVFFCYRAIRLRTLLHKPAAYQSFSFFNRVFLGENVAKEKDILSHEQVHVSQGHSFDVILMEFVIIFNWFNPVVYFIRRELKFQHECIADQLCSEDKVAYAELLVANALKVAPAALQHDFSNQSFLKKRITMLFKNKSKTHYKLAYLSVIPFLLVVVASTLIFNTSKAREIVSNVEYQIQDVALKVTTTPIEQVTPAEEPFVAVAEIVMEAHEQQDTSKRVGRISRDGQGKSQVDDSGDRLFESVEINPMPKGGMNAFRQWIANNYAFPSAAIDASVKGTVTVTYIVEADGRLTNVKVLKDIGHGTGEAAVLLLQKAEPWNPGIQNGRAVRVQYTLPIRLDLTNMGEEQVYRATPALGEERLREWLSAAFKLPRKLTAKDVDPYMYASFDVDEEGRLSNFKVKSDLEESFTNQFVNLLQNTKWIPEEGQGIPQKSKGSLWVKFGRNGKFITEYTRVELLPSPKKGMDDFMAFVRQQVEYPQEMISNKQSGRAQIYFEVARNGELTNFKVLEESHSSLGRSVADVLRQYGDWNPGIIDGRPIVTKYTLPVELRFENGVGTVQIKGFSSREITKS